MKTFTKIKVGYTAGIYGCTNEFFTIVAIDGEKIKSLHFKGMYGVEDRVANVFREHGFNEHYTVSEFGKLSTRGRDKHWEGFKSEQGAITEAQKFIGWGE